LWEEAEEIFVAFLLLGAVVVLVMGLLYLLGFSETRTRAVAKASAVVPLTLFSVELESQRSEEDCPRRHWFVSCEVALFFSVGVTQENTKYIY
jgi:hypothetical protein